LRFYGDLSLLRWMMSDNIFVARRMEPDIGAYGQCCGN